MRKRKETGVNGTLLRLWHRSGSPSILSYLIILQKPVHTLIWSILLYFINLVSGLEQGELIFIKKGFDIQHCKNVEGK